MPCVANKTCSQKQNIEQGQHDEMAKRLSACAFNFTHDPTHTTMAAGAPSGGQQLMITDGSKEDQAPTEAPPTPLSCLCLNEEWLSVCIVVL